MKLPVSGRKRRKQDDALVPVKKEKSKSAVKEIKEKEKKEARKVKKIVKAKGEANKAKLDLSKERFVEETLKLYMALLSTFSSRDHLIVGRDKEEEQIKTWLENGLAQQESQFLHICGHPGQGKTAVLN